MATVGAMTAASLLRFGPVILTRERGLRKEPKRYRGKHYTANARVHGCRPRNGFLFAVVRNVQAIQSPPPRRSPPQVLFAVVRDVQANPIATTRPLTSTDAVRLHRPQQGAPQAGAPEALRGAFAQVTRHTQTLPLLTLR